MSAKQVSTTPVQPDPAASDRKVIWRAGTIGCGVLLLLAILVGVYIAINLEPYMRYGLTYNLGQMENQLSFENYLTGDQYQELKIYLDSLKQYVKAQRLNREALMRINLVYNAIQGPLKAHQIGREQITQIRAAMMASGIPLAVQPVLAPAVPAPRPKPPVVPKRAASQRKK
jgi:hypothetical protein